jgi:hypothetical protein
MPDQNQPAPSLREEIYRLILPDPFGRQGKPDYSDPAGHLTDRILAAVERYGEAVRPENRNRNPDIFETDSYINQSEMSEDDGYNAALDDYGTAFKEGLR